MVVVILVVEPAFRLTTSSASFHPARLEKVSRRRLWLVDPWFGRTDGRGARDRVRLSYMEIDSFCVTSR